MFKRAGRKVTIVGRVGRNKERPIGDPPPSHDVKSFKSSAYIEGSVRKVFDQYDSDRSGVLDIDELVLFGDSPHPHPARTQLAFDCDSPRRSVPCHS